MACGTPVIALRGGAAVETIQHGVSGFLAHSIAELAQLTRDATVFSPAQVRQYAQEHFSAERMAHDYATLYDQVMRRRNDRALATATVPASS